MGNILGSNVVYAKAPSPAPGIPPSNVQLPPIGIVPSPPPDGDKGPPRPSSAAKEDKITNPGNFEELHKKCKDVLPVPFDGFRLAINKGLSNHYQISHTLNLSAIPNGTSYHFGATYIGGQQLSPTEAYPVILGDIDNAGSLSAQMIHQLSSKIKGKCVVQTQQKEFAMIQMDADIKPWDDCTYTLTLGNIDILGGSGIVVNHYLQRITKNLDIGAECLYHYGPGQEVAVLSLGARYLGDNWVAAAQANPGGWHASYYQKGNENVSVGVDYEYSSRLQDSCVSMGYQFDIPKANAVIKGMLDTNWTVASVFEKRLQTLPFTFLLSGMINHDKNQCRFGFALQVG